MIIHSPIRWSGMITVVTHYLDGRTEIERFPNQITNSALNLLRQALRDNTVDAEIKYMAWGDSSTAPLSSDTALGNELGRKVVSKQEDGATGEVLTTTYIAPGEATGQIEELGWFAGATASETADSGVMIARVLYSKTKTNLESVTVIREDSLEGV